MARDRDGDWTERDLKKLVKLMKSADKLFLKNGRTRRGDDYWKWVAKLMGRSHKACRSKQVRMDRATRGVKDKTKAKRAKKKEKGLKPLVTELCDIAGVLGHGLKKLAEELRERRAG